MSEKGIDTSMFKDNREQHCAVCGAPLEDGDKVTVLLKGMVMEPAGWPDDDGTEHYIPQYPNSDTNYREYLIHSKCSEGLKIVREVPDGK